MSRNAKIITGIVVGLVLLCLCGGGIAYYMVQRAGQAIEEALVEDPAQVAQMAHNITDYQLPSGYQEKFGMSLFGFEMVAMGTGNEVDTSDQILIMMMQFPQGLTDDQASMEEQMKQTLGEQTGENYDLQPVEEREVTIRGQQTQMVISEGTDGQGQQIRQATAVFEGKQGPAMLMIMGPIDRWNEQTVDSFIASMQ